MYHLRDFQGRGGRPKNAEEYFNYVHSSLRDVIEWCFGFLKARFPILKMMPPYPIQKQIRIVFACCVLHNFIWMLQIQDVYWNGFLQEDVPIEGKGRTLQGVAQTPIEIGSQATRWMEQVKDEIMFKMADHYNLRDNHNRPRNNRRR
uniref:DDE Tnp4 domain-containing protein n=1 Tax=Nelumbo nucifera TaxID=4432 RepID=A0A822XUF6_NELNU|nr:TPA_asm: hypothetical protein HUJ06_025430 [Nelumbo nucifera]